MSSQITPLFPVSGTDTAKVQGIPVSTIDPINGQVLVYNSATLQYEPAVATTGATEIILGTNDNLFAEVSTFTFLGDPETWGGQYFSIGVPTGQAYVWFDRENNAGDPAPAGFVRGIAIDPGDQPYGSPSQNRTLYANRMVTVFSTDPDLSATKNGDQIILTSRANGERSNIALVTISGSDASVAVVTEGGGMKGSVVLKSGNANADVSIKNIDGNIRFEKSSGNVILGNAAGTIALTSQLPTLGTGVATALAVNAGSAGAFVRTTDTATTTTAGVVSGIGTADTATTNALTVADYLLVPPAIMAWERITAAVTGSGTAEGNSGIYYGVGTGVTASSTSRVDSNTSAGDPWYFGNYNTGAFGATDRYIINGIFLRISSTSTGVWRFGIGKTHGGAVGQWTEAGFGFVCKNVRLWSFTHNGSTYTENDTGVDIPSGEIPMQFCILRNSTAHLFYLNRVLVATHTATGYANGRFIRIEAENGANSAAQRMRISPVTLRFL